MKLSKDNRLRIIYIFLLYILYSFLLREYEYEIKYLLNFIFLLLIFVKFVFGQLDFYAERFRLKDIFITVAINLIFSTMIFLFLKRFSIFTVFGLLCVFQILFRRVACLRYMKKRNVMIFGSNHIRNSVQEDILNSLDYEYVGYISDNRSRATKYLIGRYDDLEKKIAEKNVDELVIVKDMKSDDFRKYLKRLFDLKINGVRVLSFEEFNESIQKKIDISQINEEWLVQSNGFEILNNESQRNIKRGLDLIIAIGLLVLTIPLFLIFAVLIKLESKGPVIFRQIRIGENMKKFKVYKFRSMKMHDTEKCSKYTLDNDDRVTRVGKFMRKTRIDELPQLWNVIKGTMSFVGPRPEWDILAKEYEEQIPYYNLRHLIKPGITGWAQVMYPYGENIEDTKRKLEYDLYYIKHQDLIMDVLTILKTAKVVLFGRGK